jgi:hypothetical protein
MQTEAEILPLGLCKSEMVMPWISARIAPAKTEHLLRDYSGSPNWYRGKARPLSGFFPQEKATLHIARDFTRIGEPL